MKLSKYFKNIPALALTLMIWVFCACMIPNIWLSISEPYSLTQSLANVFLPAGIIALLLSASSHIGRTSLWMIILMFFSAFQLVLLYMYGRSVIAVDMFLNVLTTNPEEVGELLGNMLPIILAVVIIFIPPIVGGIVAVVKRWRLSEPVISLTRKSGLALTVVGVIFFVAAFFSARRYDPLCDLYPVNALYNVGLAVERTVRTAEYTDTSAGYTFSARSERPDSVAEIYIAVVGETARADNWQIHGYDRPTNPQLAGRDGLVAYSKALSQSNTTHKSVPMLLSALDADSFGDSIYVSRSLITAFKEAGFATAFISNQNRNHSFIDHFGEEADTCIFIRDDKPSITTLSYDTDLLPYLDRQLAAGHRKLLVVLHCYGSHFNYIDRYPADKAAFKPDGPAAASPADRDKQINAYDNTILLTSGLLASIMDRLEALPARSALIYTSDHGEDIFDDSRRLFLHASPCPSYWQIHVPFLVWMSSSFRSIHPDMLDNARANSQNFVASSKAYFHTLMQLAGLQSPRVMPDASLVSATYRPEPPRYLNDHNLSIPLEESGLLEPDFDCIKALGIKLDGARQ